MAISFEQIIQYIKDEDLVFARSSAPNTIYVPFTGCNVRVDLLEDGEAVGFVVRNVFNLQECPYRCAVLEFMALHTYSTKIGHFGYDPKDGEVDVSHVQPLEDGPMTQKVFARCLYCVMNVAVQDARELRQVAFTGVRPVKQPDETDTSSDDASDDEDASGKSTDQQTSAAPSFQPPAQPAGASDRQTPDAAPAQPVDPDAWPAAPITEQSWLTLLYDTLKTCYQRGEQDVPLLHTTLWPKLLDLRSTSVAQSYPYQSRKLADFHGITSADELLLAYMVFLLAYASIKRVGLNQLETFWCAGQPGVASQACQRLERAKLVQRADGHDSDKDPDATTHPSYEVTEQAKVLFGVVNSGPRATSPGLSMRRNALHRRRR